ncbi:MAG TPA: hypothetical protein VEP50_05310 [bacterium]|nr:hypothetical protein [bacterium]
MLLPENEYTLLYVIAALAVELGWIPALPALAAPMSVDIPAE